MSIAELLDLPIKQLLDHPVVSTAGWGSIMSQLVALDLGYLTLGRRGDRLSGGEHQRLRIAKVLSGKRPEGLLLILDEPSAGLHPTDVGRLLKVLDNVVGGGRNTVLLVEHNLDLIRASDWVIDFGPGGGPAGGLIVAQGSPEDVARCDTATGRALSGKQLSLPVKRSSAGANTSMPKVVDMDRAEAGRRWLKRLLGDEAAAGDLDAVNFEGLAVIFDAAANVARPHEIGGLDIDIARLLLDEPDDGSKEPQRLMGLWEKTPEAKLRIHPLIEELRVWGPNVPASARREAVQRIKRMRLVADSPIMGLTPVAGIRATGRRFQSETGTIAERAQCLRDALNIGGGYVELWVEGRGVVASARRRHLDLDVPSIAPFSVGSAGLSRSHAVGRCPCCVGNGWVRIFDQDLVIARPDLAPDSESFLRPEALAVLRGIRRSDLLPFLKRMVTEGLWSAGRPFARLSPEERTILQHGYWQRPSHGSFLKTPRSDPDDVKSWLRWNGLTCAVLEQAERSSATEWLRRLTATVKHSRCPRCDGTGLQLYTQAIRMERHSLFEWTRDGTVGEFVRALAKTALPSRRSEKVRERVLYCLDPIARAIPVAALTEPIGDAGLLRKVFERTVHSFTLFELAVTK